MKTPVVLALVLCCAFAVALVASEEECKCSKLPEGRMYVYFSNTISTTYKTEGKLTLKKLFNEVYSGTVTLSGKIPFTQFSMKTILYLNGKTCEVVGSMANPRAQISLAVKTTYDDSTRMMEGTYNRQQKLIPDNAFGTVRLVYRS